MAYAQVERLCRMDEAELSRLEAGIAETLEFNAAWGMTRLPTIQRERLDHEMLDAILAPPLRA